MNRMIGKTIPVGYGGRDCACCGDAPGKTRKLAKRSAKKHERQTWKKEI